MECAFIWSSKLRFILRGFANYCTTETKIILLTPFILWFYSNVLLRTRRSIISLRLQLSLSRRERVNRWYGSESESKGESERERAWESESVSVWEGDKRRREQESQLRGRQERPRARAWEDDERVTRGRETIESIDKSDTVVRVKVWERMVLEKEHEMTTRVVWERTRKDDDDERQTDRESMRGWWELCESERQRRERESVRGRERATRARENW